MAMTYSIGQSVQGRHLAVTRISKEVEFSKEKRQRRRILKPWVKLVANMHGNEVRKSPIFNNSFRFFLKKTFFFVVHYSFHFFQGYWERIESCFGRLSAQSLFRLWSRYTKAIEQHWFAHFAFCQSWWFWGCSPKMPRYRRETKCKRSKIFSLLFYFKEVSSFKDGIKFWANL